MPADKTATTLIRIMELLRGLPRGGSGATAKELHEGLLAKGFQIDKRSVERDLNALEEVFGQYIRKNDGGKPYGWCWRDGCQLDLIGMSTADAVSLRVIEETLKPLLPAGILDALQARFDQAGKILAELESKNKNASWAKKVRNVPPTLPMLPPTVKPDILKDIQEALLNDEQIAVDYIGLGKIVPKKLILEPRALVQRGAVTYLVATAEGYSDERLYALHRFSRAERNYLPAKPNSFDIDAFISNGFLQFGDREVACEVINFVAVVDEWLADMLSETPISENQKIRKTRTGCTLCAQVHNTRQLEWWLLSFGSAIEVIEPIELRARIATRLRDASSLYSSEH